LKSGDDFMGQGLLDHAQKASLAMNLSSLALPLEELIASAKKLEELEEEVADQNEPRQQIYPAPFAFQVLQVTVRRLSQSRRMSPQLAVEIFGPAPSSPTGDGLFLASRPRLCDVGGSPNPAEVEKCLCDGFVTCYMLDLLARGCEAELRQAAVTLVTVIDRWARQLNPSRPDWLSELSDIANAMLCVSDDRFTLSRMEALSRVQAAPRGVARKVSEALEKKPWAIKVQHAWSVGMSEINLRPKLEALLVSVPGRQDAWEEAAQALPELRESMQRGATDALESVMWRMLSQQYKSFQWQGSDADEALDVLQAKALLGRLRVGRGLACLEKPCVETLDDMEAALTARVTSADIAGRRTALFQAAATLELDHHASLDDAHAMRSTIAAVHLAAVGCRGINLGAEELSPAFERLVDFVEATVAVGSVDVGADVVLAAVDCALAMADVMRLDDPSAEVSPAIDVVVLWLKQLAATLHVKAAAAEFEKLGHDFEARLAADSNRVLRSILDALARLDFIPIRDGDRELPPVDEARAIVSNYWARSQKAALGEVAKTQAALMRLNEPSWKREITDRASWDELVAIGAEFLTDFDAGKMLDTTRQLKKAGPAARKQALR